MKLISRSRIYRALAILIATLSMAAISFAQAPQPKKAYKFYGEVKKVDAGAKSLTVANDKVEGWMGAMTMDYKLDNPEILGKLKAGDRIGATVYDRDYVLHKVFVTSKDGK